MDKEEPRRREVATLGGGCFWCLEAVYDDLRGIEAVVSGYAGGTLADPSYEQVCAGDTGHAEVVQLSFDPQEITFREILQVFFAIHDPTTRDRQGGDVGTQYRSVIFYHNPDQHRIAEEVIAEVNAAGLWGRSIVTELTPFAAFYRAEDYHQGYFRKNPTGAYCRAVVAPKVAKFRMRFRPKLKS